MPIKVGDSLPSATFKRLGPNGPEEISSEELFRGRKVALFGLPGAFTPVCSAQHLPGFVARADELKAKGIDLIACVSVNDAFVMDAWGKANKVGDKVLLLADGNGDFTKAVGLDIDASGFGMGLRSARYAMIVEDGVVKELSVEESPSTLAVSSAEALLARL